MAKKKPASKKKRAAPQGVESHQRKQERLEARRRAKEQALVAQQRRERRDRALRTTVFVAIGAVVVWLAFVRQTSPDAIAGNNILSFSTSNNGELSHTAPYNYDQESTGLDPPVSGSHSPNPAECGLYNEKIPDENFVHSLEHGAVAALYNPKEVKLPDIRALEKIVTSYEDDTLSAPYPGLEDPIVMASWSRKMPLDGFDEDAIRQYTDEFRDTEPAPEASQQDCANEADDAFEPPEPSQAPAPPESPSPDESPSPTQPPGDAKGSGKDGKMGKEEKGN